jgi:hypothetical protein
MSISTDRRTPARERPILFSGPMVRAILDGRKTQTRRAIKQCKPAGDLASEQQEDLELRGWDFYEDIWFPKCPYGRPGDRLWVRETWCQVDDREYGGKLWYDYRATPKYNASHPAGWDNEPEKPEALKWRPSIYMPRAASRITLEITAIRVERLQDLSPEDARAEVISRPPITMTGYGPIGSARTRSST